MPDIEEALQKELDQAKAGTHQRQKSEEKRLVSVKAAKLKRAEQRRQLRVGVVDARFEEQRREVGAPIHLTRVHHPISRSDTLSAVRCAAHRRRRSSTGRSP